MRKSYKGLFKPVYPDKYVGDPKGIVYRSLLEKRFMLYCDKNIDITHWASEELPVRYFNPLTKKHHRYFPDFIIKTSKKKKYMIEIKPYRQCKPPKPPTKKSKVYLRESFEYIKNQAKWNAAKHYCELNNMEFKLITEKELGKY